MLFDRRALVTMLALGGTAPVCVTVLGPRGLALYLALWTLALPWLLAPLAKSLRAELAGALFVFWTAASADYLDATFGTEQRVTLALVLLSLGYLIARRREALAVARTAPLLALTAFFAEQVVSAAVLEPEGLWVAATGRASVVAAMLAGAVLCRREGGRQLLAALVVLGAFVSVPLMIYELVDPDLVLFPVEGAFQAGPTRAGGLFAQANNVGTAISFAVALLLALVERGAIGRRAAALLGGAFVIGLLCCASRGAFAVVIVLVAIWAGVIAYRHAGRLPVASALLVGGVLWLVAPAIGRGAALATRHLEDAGLPQAIRLNEVVQALVGSPDELVDDDSSRGKLITEAVQLIAERPLFGRGTRNFTVDDRTGRGSHVQFLDVLGENGIIGGAFYAALLWALVLAVTRAPAEERFGAALALAAWFLNNFDNREVLTYRFMVLPLAWVAGGNQGARRYTRQGHGSTDSTC